jgi:MFS family permease
VVRNLTALCAGGMLLLNSCRLALWRLGTPPAVAPFPVCSEKPFRLSRPIWLIGWVSFFTDMASEMVYPLLPLFLTQVLGAGAMSLGVIEGAAEAANSALKILAGWWADRGSPKKLVFAGYGLASAVRPLIALAHAWPQVLAIRFIDRLGKGIRGAPRDAMLAALAPAAARGRVYGFHRAMDHAGAVTGPLIASAFLYFYPGGYRPLFALTILPGIVVMLFIIRIPESAREEVAGAHSDNPSAAPAALSIGAPGLGRPFYLAITVILIFSLGNASDAFLLLRLSNLGVAAFWIPLLWSALHVVKSTSSFVGGSLSDRFGRRRMIALGWIIYAVVYAAFGFSASLPVVIAIFLVYGLYFGLTEGAEKAWVADLAPPALRGTAFGLYNAALGLGGLAASVMFGLVWTRVSPRAAFLTGATLAILAALLLMLVRRSNEPSRQ